MTHGQLDIIEDFAEKSDFRAFYSENRSFYREQIAQYKEKVPVRRMWRRLEEEFPAPL